MAIHAVKVDVSKLDKSHFFQGKNGAIYLDLLLYDNREGEDQYGNLGYVKQSVPKDARTGNEPILGNFKVLVANDKPSEVGAQEKDDDDIPF